MAIERRERIALVLGIPVTREEFRKRIAKRQWDLMRRYAEDDAHKIYESIFRVGADLLSYAVSAGITVYRNARLRDLKAAPRTHDVIIIVAHWRGARVDEQDFRTGWMDRLRRARSEPGTPLYDVADEIGEPFLDDAFDDDFETREHVAGVMNRMIVSGALRKFLPGGLDGSVSTHSLILDTLSRDLFDSEFGEALQPGNQLELTDGLHPPAVIHDAIGECFTGVVDLSCCTSSVPGTLLKMLRGDTMHVLIGDQYIPPALHMRMLEHVLRVVVDHPAIPYIEARQSLAHGLFERTFS